MPSFAGAFYDRPGCAVAERVFGGGGEKDGAMLSRWRAVLSGGTFPFFVFSRSSDRPPLPFLSNCLLFFGEDTLCLTLESLWWAGDGFGKRFSGLHVQCRCRSVAFSPRKKWSSREGCCTHECTISEAADAPAVPS